MKKIPTLFVRNPDDRRYVTNEVTPGCEWVLAGEGVATRKYDGTCVMLDDDGHWWARREVKTGKVPPPGWWLVECDHVTGKQVGWEPIEQSPFFKVWRDAAAVHILDWEPGTYELIGPKVNGNPERCVTHGLVRHAHAEKLHLPGELSYESLALWMAGTPYEGIVWHHPDGRMAKLKARDFPGSA